MTDAQKAGRTRGPWHFEELGEGRRGHQDGCGYIRTAADNLEISHHGDMGRSREENLANAAAIVEWENNYDALLAENKRLREELDEMEQRLNESGTGEMGLIDTIHAVAGMIRKTRSALASRQEPDHG